MESGGGSAYDPVAPDTVPGRLDVAVDWAAARLDAAAVHFGHGADNAHTEAIILAAGATGLPLDELMADAARLLSPAQRSRLRTLVDSRIGTRTPAAYLVGRAWFAGLEFQVDPRVLIPRSPLAEFLAAGGRPWLQPEAVTRVLDLGTGSGCLAVAAARAFPGARVDAVDICAGALEVAAANVRRLVPDGRVRLERSDHFSALAGRRYDLILSNPPYVPASGMQRLPAEYAHEPPVALVSGEDGLDSVRAILHDARRFLQPDGVLVVEVGEVEEAVAGAFPDLPFIWLEFEHGGTGVFLLTADALDAGAGQSQRSADVG